MLILTRKLGETIRIGDRIKIIVLDVKGGQVKLGVDAPPNVAVHREEIYERIRDENLRAGRGPISGLLDAAKILGRRKRKDDPPDDHEGQAGGGSGALQVE